MAFWDFIYRKTPSAENKRGLLVCYFSRLHLLHCLYLEVKQAGADASKLTFIRMKTCKELNLYISKTVSSTYQWSWSQYMCISMSVCVCVCVCMHVHMHVCFCIYEIALYFRYLDMKLHINSTSNTAEHLRYVKDNTFQMLPGVHRWSNRCYLHNRYRVPVNTYIIIQVILINLSF